MALQTVMHDKLTLKNLKEGNAQKLQAQWQSLFEHLNVNNGITHFTFFDTQHIALTRLHRGERNDKVVRYNLAEAQRSGKMEWGIEIGSVGMLVLRSVHPVFEEGKIIGYVELGKKVEDVFNLLHVNLSSHFVVLMNKTLIDKQAWEAHTAAYKERFGWNKFEKSAVVYASRSAFPSIVDLEEKSDESKYNEVTFGGQTWVVYKKFLHDSSGESCR